MRACATRRYRAGEHKFVYYQGPISLNINSLILYMYSGCLLGKHGTYSGGGLVVTMASKGLDRRWWLTLSAPPPHQCDWGVMRGYYGNWVQMASFQACPDHRIDEPFSSSPLFLYLVICKLCCGSGSVLHWVFITRSWWNLYYLSTPLYVNYKVMLGLVLPQCSPVQFFMTRLCWDL